MEVDKSDAAKTAFWVVISIAIVIIVIAIVLIILASVIFSTYKSAVIGAFFNQNICSSDPVRCNYFYINPPAPTEFPDEFSKKIAIYCGQQIMSLEYFSQTHDLHLPPGLILVGTVRTQEKTAPIFAYVALDKVNRVLYIIIRGTLTQAEWSLDFTFQQNVFQGQKSLKSLGGANWACRYLTILISNFANSFPVETAWSTLDSTNCLPKSRTA